MIKIGMIIGDRYEILEKIGTGGMSDVYKAKCHKLNRFVAMKVLKQEFSENANFVSKFRIEAQAAAGLSHPNIVNVYDVGEENGIYYIVMELVEGITLKKYIEKKARLSVKEAISIAIQVCMGIEAAHNNHIIHRDIKPQNIIISKEGKVKVTDFGIAKAATSNTITSNVMGSVHYTSPEQARGGFSDAKSDIYSLGITLFEMLTGRVAFNGETTVAIAIKHIQEEMPSPREFVSEIPVSVEQIVFKCCQKSPDRRYQTMGDLVSDLKKSLMNPDEDFVRLADADEEGDTRAISDTERAQIKAAKNGNAPRETRPIRENQTRAAEREERPERRNINRDDQMARRNAPRKEGQTGRGGKESGGRSMGEVRSIQSARDRKSAMSYEDEPAYGREDDYEEDYYEYEGNGDDYGDDYSPKKERITTALAVITAILVGCVVIFMVGRAFGLFQFAFFDNGDTGEETEAAAEQVEMIEVVGRPSEEVKVALIGIGLTPVSEYKESTEYDSGIVIESSVMQGEMVTVGSDVVLTVSSGSEGVEVPELVDKTEEEATALLEQGGFAMIRAEGYDEFIRAGSVLRQDPASGSIVPEGTEVTITISLGKEDTRIPMPNLIGQTEMDAVVMLQEAGLNPGSITQVNHEDPNLTEKVCYQSYSVNTPVEKNTTVDLQISMGPAGLYRFSEDIAGPTAEEDPDFRSGTMVTITLTAADGQQLLSTQTTSFPFDPPDISNIQSASGTLLFQYVNVTEAQNITQEDGSIQTIESQTVPKEISRTIAFAEQ